MNQEPELGTDHYIFKMIYLVRVPYIQTRSVQSLKDFGVPHSGYAPFDRQVTNELIDIMIPIAKMVEYFKEGAQLYFPIQSDIKEIYDRITNHLYAWKCEIQRRRNIGDAPLDDLKDLDLFANEIYEHAKIQFTDEVVAGLINQAPAIKKLSRVSMLMRPVADLGKPKPKVNDKISILGDNVAPQAVQEEVPELTYPERESMGKFLEDREKNPGIGSLNGPHNNPANTASPSRASLANSGGLSYQSLMNKGRQSWKS